MIFHKPSHIVTHTCMRTTLAFLINMEVAEKENVLSKEFTNMCKGLADKKLSIQFVENKMHSFQ